MKRTVSLIVSVVGLSLATTPAHAVSPRQCTRKLTDSFGECTRTLVEMRVLQTAIEAYRYVNKGYPAARSIAELRALVEPTYISITPLKDAWGTEFRYQATPDGKAYVLVSAGSDKVFAEKSWTVHGLLESSQEDAVVSSQPDEREWVIQE
jgi:hypothetical protein